MKELTFILKRISVFVIVPISILLCGCVEIEQEIYMNHDGSGKIIERVALTPRGVRMLEGMKKRTGKEIGTPYLLSDEHLQARLKALGGVELVSKRVIRLPDGRDQVEVVYSFKDSNKVKYCIVPTFAYKKKLQKEYRGGFDGTLILKFTPEFESWGRIYRETVTLQCDTTAVMPPQPLCAPAERQKFIRVLPIFLDMLKEFKLSMTLIAPIEDFEERDMLTNLRADHNKVTIYYAEGQSVVQAPSMILQLIMNEVIGGADLENNQNAMPGVFTPWPAIHQGRGCRFMKSVPAPSKNP